MPKSKSHAKKNWFARLWSASGTGAALRNRRRNANKLRLEQLESRRLLAAILLDIPGINGDASGAGATATDIELTEFSWGFSRGDEDANSNFNDPIVFSDLKFTKPVDSASNDLYSQASFAPIYSTAAKLRVVDDVVTPGKNLLSFELGSGRLTSFRTDGQSESGSLSFAKVDFNESLATIDGVTNRTASWDLLSGAVAKSAITGPGNIDNSKNNQPSSNPLNIETVLEIGGQKLLIDNFSWSAQTAGNVLALPGSLTKAEGSGFQITRDVDSGTAGLLGSAAAGTNLGKVTITDRANVAGVNKVLMQWNLYDAFISEFGLSAKASELPTNTLGLSYSKIELAVTEFNEKTGVQGNTLTTIWDEAGNVVTPAATFGTADPLTADTAPVASYLDFGTLGRVRYDEIDWAVSKPTTIGTKGITQDKTTVGAMEVTLAAGPSTPALLGNLAKLNVLPTVIAKEQNTSNLKAPLDVFSLTNAAVVEFAVAGNGLEEPTVTFALDFQIIQQTFNGRSAELTTRGNFNEVTGNSTGELSFGAQTVDTLFELEITEAGITSEIPVTSAKWSASRPIALTGSADTNAGALAASTFDLTIPRGIHSPGLFAAAARGTTIDKAVVKRYEVVGEDKVELYQWELTDAFLTDFASHMRPGNSSEEIDRISFNPSKITLKTPEKTGSGPTQNAAKADFDFLSGIFGNTGGNFQNTLTADAEKAAILQMKIEGRGNFIAIDSYSWGAVLPVDKTTETGARPLGDPDASALSVKVDGLPSAPMLGQLLSAKVVPTTKLALPSGKAENPAYLATLTSVFATAYAYQDEITATSATNSLSLAPTVRAELAFTPLTATGLGTPRSVDWDLAVDINTTQTGGLGGFQFAPNSAPPMVLEFFDGTTRSQVELDGYAFGTANKVEQAVGKSGSSAPLAPRGISTPGSFKISTRMDETTPGLFAAIALKTKLPEIKIIERGNAVVGGVSQFVPVREWTLRDVYIEDLGNAAEAGDVQARIGTINLSLNPGSAESTLITYGLDSKAIRAERKIDFVTPPTPLGDILIGRSLSEESRVINLPSSFSDEQENASTLRYSVTVVSGANSFDSVSITATNQLLLDYNVGQFGSGELRVDAMDSFGLIESITITIVASTSTPPSGTDKTVTISEDSNFTFTAADFGFSDPNDTPSNTFTGLLITSLPSLGSLTLSNVAVASNQLVSIASINAGLLKFTPVADANGNSYASFQFQVQDNGPAGLNLDLTPNLIAFDVTPVNDAPVLLPTPVTLTLINEDNTNPSGTLVSALLTNVSDADAGALRGMAVRSVQDIDGIWQFSLDGGLLWERFGNVRVDTARLLPSTARVRFVPDAHFNGGRSIEFSAWDQTTGNPGQRVNLSLPNATGGVKAHSTGVALARQNVRAVNDAPTISAQNAATATVGTPLVFSKANGNLIRVSDLDADEASIQVAFITTNGKFTLSRLTGLTVTTGSNGSSSFTVRGTVADLNAALNGSSFESVFGITGPAFLRLNVNDLNNTGVGGAKTASKVMVVTVQAINLGALSASNPTLIANGTTSDTFQSPSVYSFTLGATSDVRVALSGLTNIANLRLTNSLGQSIGSTVIATAEIKTVLANGLAAGTYQIVVSPLSVATPFNLAVSSFVASDDLIVNANDLGTLNTTTPTARFNNSVGGSEDKQDYYRVVSTGLSSVRVNLSALSTNANVELLNSDGVVIGSSVLPGTSVENVLNANLFPGTYFVRVFTAPGEALTTYDLTVSLATTSDDSITQATFLGDANATTLPVLRFTRNSIGGPGNIQDLYRFGLAAPTDVRVNLTGLSQDNDVSLLDEFGRTLVSGTNSGNLSESVLASGLASGTYYVRVIAFGASVSSYELAVAIDPASDDLLTNAVSLGALSATVPTIQRTGNVNSTSDRTDYYSFSLGATNDVRVNLSGLTGDADLRLEDSFGRVIASGLLGGSLIENLSATALAAGTYHIRVNTLFAATNYLLAVSQTPASDDLISNAVVLSALTSGTSPTARTSGAVGASDLQDYYRFQLNTAGNMRLNLSGMTTDLSVEILDQFGNVIVFGSQPGNTIERVTTPELAVGTYYIRVFQLSGASSNYILEISRDFNGDDLVRGGNNLGTLASTALTASGAVGGAADIQDYYSFTLTSTRNVRFLLTGLTADIDLHILDSFGRLIQSGTSGSTSTEDLTVNGLVAGLYYIRVFPFGAAVSNYSLSVTGVSAAALLAGIPVPKSSSELPVPDVSAPASSTPEDKPTTQEQSLDPNALAMDFNGDGRVSPLDALLILNALRAKANGELPLDETDFDINGDGHLTPVDALLVINMLNRRQIQPPLS